MGTDIPYDIVGSFSKSYSTEFDPKELVNLFVNSDRDGKRGKAVYPMPGLSSANGIRFIGNKGGRRLYKFGDNVYAVIGRDIYRIGEHLTATAIGQIDTETGYVGISSNIKEVIFVDGTGGWLWNEQTSTFSVISAAGFPTQPTDVDVLGDRFVVSEADSAELHYSGINDGTAWDALDKFAIDADKVVGIRTLNDRLFVMGNKKTQTWYNAGTPILPFRLVDTLPYGCSAVGSIAKSFGFLMWLSKDDDGVGTIIATTGTQPKPISTAQIDTEFQRYEDVSDASAFIYRNDQGHVFYQISLTAANKTWAHDIIENRFIRLEYNSKDRHLAQDHVFFNGKHYVIDYSAPVLYELSNQHYSDDGVNIRRKIIGPPIFDKNDKHIVFNSIVFDLKQGIGSGTCDFDYDPKIRIRMSRDGGITYANERTATIGKGGQGTWISKFTRFGRARTFVPMVTYDGNTTFILLGATININIGGAS